MWRCKECCLSVSSRPELLKHFRLQHYLRQHYPCPHTNCPCSFKTWNALRIHLSRINPKPSPPVIQELSTFSCHLCPCSSLPTEREYFVHIGTHLKNNETVRCMFEGCTFQTNMYGTFHSHKNRKYNPHTLKHFKPGIVANTQVLPEDSESPGEIADNQNDPEAPGTSTSCDADMTNNLLDVFEQNFAAALLKLEHFSHVPGSKLDEFLEELNYLLRSTTLPFSIKILEGLFKKHGIITDESLITEVASVVCESNPLLKAIGKSGALSTSYLRNHFYKNKFNVIQPIEYTLDGKEKKTFQYVPVLKSLQQMLERKDVVDKVVENHNVQQSKVSVKQHAYRSSQDGSHLKENIFLSGGELRILLKLYIDEFEICNPLGTSRRKHKLCGIYWTLNNLPACLHSSLPSICLAILCKSDDLKKYGYEPILHPLLQDVKTLEQDGLHIPLLGKCLKGTIQFVVADNLGADSLSGLNESFSSGYICRFCTGTKADIQTNEVKSSAFSLRRKELHAFHVKTATENGASSFGVKNHCIITKTLTHFSIHTGYPPDVMHDVFEGVVPAELAYCLGVLVKKKIFSLETLNRAILHFPYKWGDKRNKPHAIPLTFSTRKTIGGNAHENWSLLRLLPFIIGHLVPEGEPAWEVLLDLKDIMELVVAPTHTDESIAYLEVKISGHRQKFQELFPDVQLIPKHHYIEHYPQLVRMFGLLVELWTMRFEAKHSYFKQVVRHINCFKNVPLTLAKKHQLMMGYHMRLTSLNKSVPKVTSVSTLPVAVLKQEIVQAIDQNFPGTTEVHLVNSVTSNGVNFKKGMLVVHGSTSGLPDFAEILQIYIVNDKPCFIVKRVYGWYREHFRAFELTSSSAFEILLIRIDELVDDYPLADYFVGPTRMVALKRFINLLLEDVSTSKAPNNLRREELTKLTLPDGIPESVGELADVIKKQCGIEGHFRLQYMDADFGNEFTNLDSISDVLDKGTLRVVFNSESPHLTGSPPPSYSAAAASQSLDDSSSFASGSSSDTYILSSPKSTSSRTSSWPLVFNIPRFSYEAELQLEKANTAFRENGTLLNPDVKLKSAIMDGLMEMIVKYKVYLSDAEFSEIAEALITAHPCLKEPGSTSGFGGWKTSLKYKLGNYRSKLRRLGCPEVSVNSLQQKPDGRHSPAYSVKKPKKAEVNYCPPHLAGESAETLEQIRVKLLSEITIRNNEDKVAAMMDKTFSLRRLEVVQDAPMVADFKAGWPGLFSVREVNAEFKRITTVELQSKYFSQLDAHSENLMKVFARKGGVLGKKLKAMMVPMTRVDSIEVRRECILRSLSINLNEDPQKFVKDYKTNNDCIERELAETVFGIYVIRQEGADPDDRPEDIGVILEGVEVLSGLRSVPFAMAMFLGLVYALNISYPPELKYTFEAVQKIIMEMEGNRLSAKVQNLKTLLAR